MPRHDGYVVLAGSQCWGGRGVGGRSRGLLWPRGEWFGAGRNRRGKTVDCGGDGGNAVPALLAAQAAARGRVESGVGVRSCSGKVV